MRQNSHNAEYGSFVVANPGMHIINFKTKGNVTMTAIKEKAAKGNKYFFMNAWSPLYSRVRRYNDMHIPRACTRAPPELRFLKSKGD